MKSNYFKVFSSVVVTQAYYERAFLIIEGNVTKCTHWEGTRQKNLKGESLFGVDLSKALQRNGLANSLSQYLSKDQNGYFDVSQLIGHEIIIGELVCQGAQTRSVFFESLLIMATFESLDQDGPK